MYQDYRIEGAYSVKEYFDITIAGKDATDALNQLKPFLPVEATDIEIELVMPEQELELLAG